ncbi:hypothetical protein K440107A6_15650 [Lawsonibacter asaccharolyticus]
MRTGGAYAKTGKDKVHDGTNGAENMIDETIKAKIKAILAKGDRVELIPVKNGVKIIHIKREEVKL